MSSQSVRLSKYLAHTLGISRREADQWISNGRLTLNGKVAILGIPVDAERDTILLDGKPLLKTPTHYTYVLVNKPVGYVCSRRQQGDAPTIYALLPAKYHSLKVAGRLDKDSCGLVLLTDDGDTIFQLTHPKFEKQKRYQVKLDRELSVENLEHIERGVKLEDGVSHFKISQHSQSRTYRVIMHEGRNRQIRRTFRELGYTVTHLERQQIASYSLDQLQGKVYLQI